MGKLEDALSLFMALSPLQEVIIRATVNNGRLIELKHRLVIIDATFVKEQTQEVLYYLRPRIASKNWMSVWKSLTILHLMMNEGDSPAVLTAMQSELPKIQQMAQFTFAEIAGPLVIVLAYAKYLTWRATIGYERGRDLVRRSLLNEEEESRGIGQLLEDGTVEVLFSLLAHLSQVKFFVDDFDHPIMIQSAQIIFDDFLRVYESLTKFMIVLLSTRASLAGSPPSRQLTCHLEQCQPISPGAKDDLKLIICRFTDIQHSLEEFLSIFRKVEHLTDRKVPNLLSLPKMHKN